MIVLVIGGGPAGMLAAISASKPNIDVILVEKNEKLGKKLFITGKGRCNVTNNADKTEFFKNIVRNPKFMFSSFSQFSNFDLKKILEDNGCALKVERGNRVFPVSDKSYDVTDALKRLLKKKKVDVRLNTEVYKIVQTDDNKFDVYINLYENNTKDILNVDKVIVATGGLAYPSTGSTGDGYKFAKNMGINVVDQEPSLVPLAIKEKEDIKLLSGGELKNVQVTIPSIKFSNFGEMSFTDFGMTGPIILTASAYLLNVETKIYIDLKPALSEDKIDDRLLREFAENNKKNLRQIIETLLPNFMIDLFINRLSRLVGKEVELIANNRASEVDRELRKAIIYLLKNLEFTITGKRGFDEAIITKGGIDTKAINPKTMECIKVKGLYFVGEVLDIDCLTGGYNITIAASTGYAAGANIDAI